MLIGPVTCRAVGSGEAERRRRPTAQQILEIKIDTEVLAARSANKGKHIDQKIAVLSYEREIDS